MGLSGFQCHGLVGPKIAIVGVPIAADTCISPESLVTETSAAASARIALRKSLLVRSRTRLAGGLGDLFGERRLVRSAQDPDRCAVLRERTRQLAVVADRPGLAFADRAGRERDDRPAIGV